MFRECVVPSGVSPNHGWCSDCKSGEKKRFLTVFLLHNCIYTPVPGRNVSPLVGSAAVVAKGSLALLGFSKPWN